MTPRASFYIKQAIDETVFLVDNNDGSVTITNDAESVVASFLKQFGPRLRLFYQDTEGDWAELCHDGRQFTNFAPTKERPR